MKSDKKAFAVPDGWKLLWSSVRREFYDLRCADCKWFDSGKGCVSERAFGHLKTSPIRRCIASWQQELLEIVATNPSGRLLEVGCGKDNTVVRLVRRRHSMEVVRVDPRYVGNPPTVICGRAESLPFDDGEFDYVTAVCTTDHWDDTAAGVSECFRVLGPGGRLFIDFPVNTHCNCEICADGKCLNAQRYFGDGWKMVRFCRRFYSVSPPVRRVIHKGQEYLPWLLTAVADKPEG